MHGDGAGEFSLQMHTECVAYKASASPEAFMVCYSPQPALPCLPQT